MIMKDFNINKREWYYIFLFLLLMYSPWVQSDAEQQHQYVTWQGAEMDKAASIWLIKHFIDRDAEFKFLPYGSLIPSGFSFDVPLSKFSRNHKQSTFDTLLTEYQLLSDPTLKKMAQIVHEIEINTWRPKAIKESILVDTEWVIIQKRYGKQTPPINCIMDFFDKLYQQLSKQNASFLNIQNLSEVCQNN